MEVPKEFMSRYIERRKKDLAACLQALENDDFTDIEKVGHQLKGNGSTFGHPELSSIGKNIELAARCHDLQKLRKALNDFSGWVETHH
jgi:HPt (histidine-containing phosphotransfer) domain-containing protein